MAIVVNLLIIHVTSAVPFSYNELIKLQITFAFPNSAFDVTLHFQVYFVGSYLISFLEHMQLDDTPFEVSNAFVYRSNFIRTQGTAPPPSIRTPSIWDNI